MNPPHRTHRPDGNRDEIVKALEARGWEVRNTPVGEGWPDIVLIGWQINIDGERTYQMYPHPIEIKNGNAPYTPKEQAFMEKHPGLVVTVRSVEDVERLF